MRSWFALVLMMVSFSAFAQDRGLLATADKDKDGRVTREEFAAAKTERFSRLDRNGDGVLDDADLPKRLARRDDDHPLKADRNGDGKVTRDEFVTAPTPGFDAADTNDDDMLDVAELESARTKLKERAAQRRG